MENAVTVRLVHTTCKYDKHDKYDKQKHGL